MARTYAYNEQAAQEAGSGGKRINEHGTYTGKFTQAWAETNEKGTESVNFTFAADNGQEAGPLVLYTHNNKGEELPGFKVLQAIIGSLRLRGVKPQPGTIKVWDYDTRQEVEKKKEVFPALVGQPIGLVLTTESYLNRNDEEKMRIVINAAFTHDTRQMPVELSSGGNGALTKYQDWLTSAGRWHKPLKSSAPKPQPATETQFDDDDFNF